jgi:hypothetical protein
MSFSFDSIFECGLLYSDEWIASCPTKNLMFFPFRRELDEAFSHDRSIWLKMAGCALVGILIAVYSLVRLNQNELTPTTAAIVIAVTGFGGMVIGIFLSLKDVVTRRMENGEPVNWLLKVYFGLGGWSLLIWFVTIFGGTVAGLILTLGV